MAFSTGTLSLSELALRLGVAAAFGALVGLNRNLHDKPAGLRTHALVSLGSALVVIIGLELEGASPGLLASGQQAVEWNSLSRIIQGILQGVGFLGAGVILHSEAGKKVHGLTTAASIWIAAIAGVACSVGYWPPTIIAFFIVFIVLVLGGPIERAFHRLMGSEGTDESQ